MDPTIEQPETSRQRLPSDQELLETVEKIEEEQPQTKRQRLEEEVESDFSVSRSDVKTYTINQQKTKSFKGNVLTEQTYTVKFTESWTPGTVASLLHLLGDIFTEVLERAKMDHQSTDLCRVFHHSPSPTKCHHHTTLSIGRPYS